ncbi:hypothetical protein [Arthrobacter glacialis]|uniref:hypothetical protein n=1 Tax=Arthrobacter glacialis TaxID=1664 RepID=UPI000CD3C56F|nr:hypothetical protein [Arthrobacter glacialis]POH58896.1 hypothetical protein CVS28_09310 [Arthrobacter glacialis]
MALEVDWREPPLSTEERLKELLKHHPGRWARVKIDMASPTSRSVWRKEGFESESHPAESNPKKFDIYARWPAASMPGTRSAVGLTTTSPVAAAHAAEPTTASKTKPVTTKNGVPAVAKAPVPAGDTDLQIPTSGDVTGGYLASRALRHVPADGTHEVRLSGPKASPVRP